MKTFDLKRLDLKRKNDYRGLARKIASGEIPNDETITSVVLAAGRTLATLQADVVTLQARAQAAADLQEAESLQPKIDAAQAEHERLNAIWQEVRAERDAAVQAAATPSATAAALTTQLRERQKQLRQTAQRSLLSTCDRAAYDREMQVLAAERTNLLPTLQNVGTTDAARASIAETAGRVAEIESKIEALDARRLDPGFARWATPQAVEESGVFVEIIDTD